MPKELVLPPNELYCWFSHDVIKIQTRKPLILLLFDYNNDE